MEQLGICGAVGPSYATGCWAAPAADARPSATPGRLQVARALVPTLEIDLKRPIKAASRPRPSDVAMSVEKEGEERAGTKRKDTPLAWRAPQESK